MEDQYGMGDLRQYMSSRPLFPPPPPESLSSHPYDMLIFRSDSGNNSAGGGGGGAAVHCYSGFESAGRWPRQETLTLLEIRARLDPKFKEANQKGPLWDQVSRVMSEEHGYQRSGKKCREKFENLYKYYKKTKEGKAGRQDGKHYRFFRQLEALYGGSEANIDPAPHPNLLTTSKVSDTSLSLSNYSEADTSSSDNRDWKIKISDFMDAHMKKMMEKQEAWMEKMMRAMEEKERERATREEEWRKHDAARIESEREFWASERAWIESRDAALMDALHSLTGNGVWPECEINRLMQLTEGKFEEEMVWEEIASKMACFGHERSAAMCKQKWESIHNYVSKKSKAYCDQGNISLNPNPNPNPNPNAASGISESCFRYFVGDDYGRIID
ncbi:hypothetical protein SASPL_108622 [Salvia splendens]|uniref:Myb-like domain-containing protein n=1 Tax=Salvia splendens TaxID=180675 RepID=A0A8X8YH17_SALSN|nr:trihelix transcription factor PTL-like [Salvia splendens]KAG6430552.1 hypothetical protein SASPL_108622 [Salvia splendens]